MKSSSISVLVVAAALVVTAGSHTSHTSHAASAKVKAAQEQLNKLGYDVGEPDGAWGGKSRAALNAFQKAQGFPRTRRLDKSAIAVLEILTTGGEPTKARKMDEVIGKTLILDSGFRVYYSPKGKKILRLRNGKRITKKWRKRADGTYCEYWFSKKKMLCGVDRDAMFIAYKKGDANIYFDRKTGKRLWAVTLADGDKLKP